MFDTKVPNWHFLLSTFWKNANFYVSLFSTKLEKIYMSSKDFIYIYGFLLFLEVEIFCYPVCKWVLLVSKCWKNQHVFKKLISQFFCKQLHFVTQQLGPILTKWIILMCPIFSNLAELSFDRIWQKNNSCNSMDQFFLLKKST